MISLTLKGMIPHFNAVSVGPCRNFVAFLHAFNRIVSHVTLVALDKAHPILSNLRLLLCDGAADVMFQPRTSMVGR
jgi:hypothetical protein